MTKKNAVAKVPKESAALSRASRAIERLEEGFAARLDLVEQKYSIEVRTGAADVSRLDQKLDALREVLASGAGVTDQREEFFVRRVKAMEAYGRGEAGPDQEWIERDLGESSVPRGALSVASAFGVNRELIEQMYSQYQAAYAAAFKRWHAKYPDGVRPAGHCFACGQRMPGDKPNPLPHLERRP